MTPPFSAAAHRAQIAFSTKDPVAGQEDCQVFVEELTRFASARQRPQQRRAHTQALAARRPTLQPPHAVAPTAPRPDPPRRGPRRRRGDDDRPGALPRAVRSGDGDVCAGRDGGGGGGGGVADGRMYEGETGVEVEVARECPAEALKARIVATEAQVRRRRRLGGPKPPEAAGGGFRPRPQTLQRRPRQPP